MTSLAILARAWGVSAMTPVMTSRGILTALAGTSDLTLATAGSPVMIDISPNTSPRPSVARTDVDPSGLGWITSTSPS